MAVTDSAPNFLAGCSALGIASPVQDAWSLQVWIQLRSLLSLHELVSLQLCEGSCMNLIQ